MLMPISLATFRKLMMSITLCDLFLVPTAGARLAKVNTDAVFDASSETVVLYPENGGNLHCFTALTPCAVLDVLGPPYNRADGRDCAYYDESPYLIGEFLSFFCKQSPAGVESIHSNQRVLLLLLIW
jgi:hypothetical protein